MRRLKSNRSFALSNPMSYVRVRKKSNVGNRHVTGDKPFTFFKTIVHELVGPLTSFNAPAFALLLRPL
jgi:hypothetical protein